MNKQAKNSGDAKKNTYQVLHFSQAKTFCIFQMVQKTARSSNLHFEGDGA
jgi:hypothetical protein